MKVLNPVISQWQQLCELKSSLREQDMAAQEVLTKLYNKRHGHFDQWLAIVNQLPKLDIVTTVIDQACPRVSTNSNSVQQAELEVLLKFLMPWRKGPFQIGGSVIDSEWRSDFKYQRLLDLGLSFQNKHILDVGTGNGYFLYRLLGSGAQLALGVDPSWHYFAQFLALQCYFSQSQALYLPVTLDDILLRNFDIVMSMGVLYHRRDPVAHLCQLRDTLRTQGYLVVETLVIDGDEQAVLMPKDRYAGMRNVWFIPSVAALKRWLVRLGFNILAESEVIVTTSAEQRATAWMQRQSLADFITIDGGKTNEGLPPPKRVIIIGQRNH